MSKTILLTGATGFLGSHLIKKILEFDYKVIVLKRSYSNIDRIKTLLKVYNVKSYNVDLCDIEDIFKENHIDIIIHCATEYGRTENSSSKIL